jgi:proteic killer suppression protein
VGVTDLWEGHSIKEAEGATVPLSPPLCKFISAAFVYSLNEGLEKFFYDGDKRGIQPAHVQKIADILDRLDASVAAQDMNYPGSSLHQLKGKLKGIWSVKVSGNWRITYKFMEGNAYVVDYRD